MEQAFAREVTESITGVFKNRMNSLGIPHSPLKLHFQGAKVDQETLLENEIYPFLDSEKPQQAWHSARVPLYLDNILKYLGASDYVRRIGFVVGTAHDRGKQYLLEQVDKEGFTQEDRKKIEFHTDISVIPREYGDLIASTTELHHKHQRRPYPENPVLPITPESWTLSQLLAVADFFDSVKTRKRDDHDLNKMPNNGVTNGNNFCNEDEARGRLVTEYFDLQIKYSGDLLPKLNLRGEELIDKLYSAGIFGKQLRWIRRVDPVYTKEEKELHHRFNPFW